MGSWLEHMEVSHGPIIDDGQFEDEVLTDWTVKDGKKNTQDKTFCGKRDKHIVNKCDSKLKRDLSGSLT